MRIEAKLEIDCTVNRALYRKLYKRKVSLETGKCDRCGWHSGENVGRQPKHRSWKKLRSTQYSGECSFQSVYRKMLKFPPKML